MKQKEYLLYLLGWNLYYSNMINSGYFVTENDKKNYAEFSSKLRSLLELMRETEPKYDTLKKMNLVI